MAFIDEKSSDDKTVFNWPRDMEDKPPPENPAGPWIRARTSGYPSDGQAVKYWFRIVGGPYTGTYSKIECDFCYGPDHPHTHHQFGGKHGFLTDEDVWYIILNNEETK